MDTTTAPPRLDEYGFPVKEASRNVHDIYNREAKAHDTAMVERWKTAMEGILIFAGLFSAVVTAFIIEGYKSLKPNSEDLTVVLLYQISQQIAVMTNRTQVSPSFLLPPLSEVPFSPPGTVVTANILWFLNLGLSLACAVAATLVQQWTSKYIHTIARRPSAERRARMRMYLFEGVQRFGMLRIVDGVPALLHLSLFSFFLGLVFFIQPISLPLTAVAAIILACSVAAYLYATLLPLSIFDTPSQTPLTNVLWCEPMVRKLYWICPRALIIPELLGAVAKQVSSPFARAATSTWVVIDLCVRQAHSILERTRPKVQNVFPSSGISKRWRNLPLPTAARERWHCVKERWSYPGFEPLDTIRSSEAHATKTLAFQEREKRVFSWLVKCFPEDREIIPFIEAMPTFVRHAHEDHDAQSTFSHVFCDSRLRLFARLPEFVERYENNERVLEAFVEFCLCVKEEDWRYVFGMPQTNDSWWETVILRLSELEQRSGLVYSPSLSELRLRIESLRSVSMS